MKVKEFMRKINVYTMRIPVMLTDWYTGELRVADLTDFGDYYYKEMDKTVKSIDIQSDRVTVYYK